MPSIWSATGAFMISPSTVMFFKTAAGKFGVTPRSPMILVERIAEALAVQLAIKAGLGVHEDRRRIAAGDHVDQADVDAGVVRRSPDPSRCGPSAPRPASARSAPRSPTASTSCDRRPPHLPWRRRSRRRRERPRPDPVSTCAYEIPPCVELLLTFTSAARSGRRRH